MSLTEPQIRRYSRHILLPDVGGRGQQRLLASCVRAAVGPDNLSELVALTYLAAAGVGTLIVDGDSAGSPSADELRWGIVYGHDDGQRSRLDAIRQRLEAINPDVSVQSGSNAQPRSASPGVQDQTGSSEVYPRPPSAPPHQLTADRADNLADALIAGGLAASRTLHELIRG